jgi:Domain of unknown function (DUF4062)
MDKRYQVFVSSTYTDLKEERAAVIQAVMKMGHIPTGMELFSAIDEEQFRFIKRIIDDSDYYVLIVGGRYGTLTAEGMSYTEKEYNYAVERGLRVLAFLHRKPDEIPLGKSEGDPDIRRLLDAFREKVGTGRVIDYWTRSTDLVQVVTTSLVQTMTLYPGVGWVKANQLANTEALTDLNELRKRNEELESHAAELKTQVGELQTQITEPSPADPDLAGLDDSYELSGSHTDRHYGESDWNFEVTWGELFAAIAPHILAVPNDIRMENNFDSSIRALYAIKIRNAEGYYNWSLLSRHYQTVKIQLIALKLITVEIMGTTDGSQLLFWSLTPKGKAFMFRLRTVKKEPNET